MARIVLSAGSVDGSEKASVLYSVVSSLDQGSIFPFFTHYAM